MGAAAIWGAIAVAGGVLVSRLFFPRVEPWVTRVFWSLAGVSHVFPDVRTFYSYLVRWTLQFAGFLLAAGSVLRVSRCPIWLRWRAGRVALWEVLAVVVVLTDLVAFGAGLTWGASVIRWAF